MENLSFLRWKTLIFPIIILQFFRATDVNSACNSFLLNFTESEFNDFEPRLKSTKNRFQLNAGINLEKFNTIFSETNHI